MDVLYCRVHGFHNVDKYLHEIRIAQVRISLFDAIREHLRICKDFQCAAKIQVDKTKVLYECAEDAEIVLI